MVASDDGGEWGPEECAETATSMHDARLAVITGTRMLPSLENPGILSDLITDLWQT